jgi:hypothetical protein
VSVSDPWRDASPLLWAAFVEDINHAVVGGLHAELLADAACDGPLAGAPDDDAPLRASLQSAAAPGDGGRGAGPFFLRFCAAAASC